MPGQRQGALGDRVEQRRGAQCLFRRFSFGTGVHLQSNGEVTKTHSGARSEFARLALEEPLLDRSMTSFLARAYALKEVADYKTGPDSMIPSERSSAALEAAEQFVGRVAVLLEEAHGCE